MPGDFNTLLLSFLSYIPSLCQHSGPYPLSSLDWTTPWYRPILVQRRLTATLLITAFCPERAVGAVIHHFVSTYLYYIHARLPVRWHLAAGPVRSQPAPMSLASVRENASGRFVFLLLHF